MKTLYVLRHAKSSWENHQQTDFERPLNERGLLTAPRIGKLMRDQSFVPDLIISSPATRAKITAEIVRDKANFQSEIQLDKRIYEALAENLFDVLSSVLDDIESVLLVGHNPGLENLVGSITGEIRAMPTATLVVIELKIEKWKEIRPACGKLRNLFTPKEIAD
jgi:phosphohistidine phosphatase